MSFWTELSRRNVVKVAAAYLIVAWLIAQVVTLIEQPLALPAWFDTVVLVLLGIGFPLALLFAWAFEITPDGLKKTVKVPPEQSIARATGQRLNYAVTALLAVAVVFLIADNYVLVHSDEPEAGEPAVATDGASSVQSPPPPTASRDVLPNSVAVLPLENLSPDPDNDYFAAGMHEEIVGHLARLRNLNVISRTSVLRYGENRPPIPEIARELNVESIVEGSIRFDGDDVRVSAQLIDAATDSHLWSETYERELASVFSVQADIAMNVANALAVAFTPEEQSSIERQPTESLEAYTLLLQARFDASSTQERHELLDRALALDPEFAAAHGDKAYLYSSALTGTIQAATADPARRADLEGLIRRHAERALELDAGIGRAHSALGQLHLFTWRWTEAREHFEQAAAADPADAYSMVPYVLLCAYSDRPAQAIELADRFVRLNPDNPGDVYAVLGVAQAYANDYAAAAPNLRFGVESAAGAGRSNLVPVFRGWLISFELARGNAASAARELERLEETYSPPGPVSAAQIAYWHTRLGHPAPARRTLRDLERSAADGAEIGAGEWAFASLAAGDEQRTLEWLETAAEKAAAHEADPAFHDLMELQTNFANDPLLETPRFVDVRNRIRGD